MTTCKIEGCKKRHYMGEFCKDHLAIEDSRKRIAERGPAFVPRKGDNFDFVCWGEIADLKLWEKR